MAYDPLSLEEGSTKNYWNYSKPEEDGYSLQLSGTVVGIEINVRRAYQTNEPMFFKNGNPMLSLELLILDANGAEWAWSYPKKPKSYAYQAVINALKGIGAKSQRDLLGKMVTVQTQCPPPGFAYGATSPRPWSFQIIGEGDASKVRDVVDNSANVQQQAAAQVPQPAMQGNPQVMQAAQQAMQASIQGNALQMPRQQAMPMQQAAAQQQVPAQVYADQGVYDEDVPF